MERCRSRAARRSTYLALCLTGLLAALAAGCGGGGTYAGGGTTAPAPTLVINAPTHSVNWVYTFHLNQPNDPQVEGFFFPAGSVGNVEDDTVIAGKEMWVPSFNGYNNVVNIHLLGPVPGTLPVTYTVSSVVAPGQASLLWIIDVHGLGSGTLTCRGATGSVTVTEYGSVGQFITGTFAMALGGDAGCPTPVDGSFMVERL